MSLRYYMVMSAPKRKPDVAEVAELIRKFLRAKARAKKLYDRADVHLAEIAKAIKPGDEVPLTEDGKKAVLIDNFAGKSVVWGHGGVRHYDIDVIDA
jgi:hypothetical protein